MPVAPNASKSALEHGRNRVAYELMSDLDVKALLDYGCGNARFAAAVASRSGAVTHACDIDLARIEEIRPDEREMISFFQVTEKPEALPLADRQISIITCCDVLEHMPASSRLASLEEFRRVLRTDGALIVTVPHRGLFARLDPENAKFRFPRVHRFVFTLLRGTAKYRQRYGGDRFGNFSAGMDRHHHFTVSELSETMATAGFSIDRVRYFTLLFPFAHSLLWVAEALGTRFGWSWPVDVARALYTWDSDLEPGKAGYSVAIRARPNAAAPRSGLAS